MAWQPWGKDPNWDHCYALLKRDSEVKILLACTHDEMHTILALHNVGSQSAILVAR